MTRWPSSARLVVVAGPRDDVVAGVVAEAVPGVYDGDLDDHRRRRRPCRPTAAPAGRRPGDRRASARSPCSTSRPCWPCATGSTAAGTAPDGHRARLAQARGPRPAYSCVPARPMQMRSTARARTRTTRLEASGGVLEDAQPGVHGHPRVSAASTAGVGVAARPGGGADYSLAAGGALARRRARQRRRPRGADPVRRAAARATASWSSATAPAWSSRTSSGSPAWSRPPAAWSGPTGR